MHYLDCHMFTITVPIYAGLDKIQMEAAANNELQELIHKLQADSNFVSHYSWDGTDLRYKGHLVLTIDSSQKSLLLKEFRAVPSAGQSGYLCTYKRSSIGRECAGK